MANFGDFRGSYDKMIALLKAIELHTETMACCGGGGGGGDVTIINAPSDPIPVYFPPEAVTAQQTAAATNSPVPSDYTSVAIVKTNGTGTVVITLGVGTFTLTQEGEVFAQAATPGRVLPAYGITTSDGGEWKWHGVQN